MCVVDAENDAVAIYTRCIPLMCFTSCSVSPKKRETTYFFMLHVPKVNIIITANEIKKIFVVCVRNKFVS